jgi:ATP-binding protein involved in chromosome partitioning
MATKDDVLAALNAVKGPDGAPLPQTGKLSDVVASDGKVFFSITVDAGVVPQWEPVRKAAEAAVRAVPGVRSAMVALTGERSGGSPRAAPPPAQPQGGHAHAPRGERPVQGPPGVAAIVAVASGKGGVGKSTTAVNLALGLRDLGLKVGVLDADIYGPSVPKLLAIRGRPETLAGNRLKPMTGYGLTVMSIGFLVAEDTPMIWRGPMATSALTQLLTETRWGDLDYLILDLPPGTGDIQLTMAQKIPVAGAVVVTTPQDVATLDARKALKMFEKVEVPVLGLVENMAVHVCSNCGHAEHIFGEGGGQRMAAQYGVPLLGSLPLEASVREQGDAGVPIVAAGGNTATAHHFQLTARRVVIELAKRAHVARPLAVSLLG